jgi:CRP-like cAMP-binding protein
MSDIILQRKVLAEGEVVFKEGDDATSAFLIQDGEVEIFRTVEGQKKVLATIGKGGLFGEMGLIDSKPRAAGAQAKAMATVVVVTRAMFQEKLAKCDPFIRALLNIFVDTIRRVQK